MARFRAWQFALVLIGLGACAVILALLIPRLSHLSLAQVAARPRQSPAYPPATPAPGDAIQGHNGQTAEHVLIALAISLAVGVLAVNVVALHTVCRRLRKRVSREYGLYELKLSMHDEAQTQDLVAMVEALANAVRELPTRRAHDGQPFIALEAHYAPGLGGQMEWVLCVRCEKDVVASVDGIVSTAYPDVRIGYEFIGPPQEIGAGVALPGHVLRLRKERAFVYPITDDDELSSASPLEAVAQAQVAVGTASCVRIQLTPCMLSVERVARERLRHHERKLAGSGTRASVNGQTLGAFDCSEMVAASEAQNRAWCWAEVQVATDTLKNAKRIAAALTARRGENRLQRRLMILREGVYRRRFPTAYPLLLPSLSLRTLLSASEIAHLIQLPGARLKGVPVSRLALARVPAPPDVGFAREDLQPELPPTSTTQHDGSVAI